MAISNIFSVLSSLYSINSLKKIKDFQKSDEIISNDHPNQQIDSTCEILSKAVLYQLSDNRLQFHLFGTKNCLIFKNERQLDNYLRRNENVDIWEIEDKRKTESKIIYKYHNGWDEEETFTCIDRLYREISSTAEQGVFCIYYRNTNQKKFIQQKQGIFQYGFEEIPFEKAQEIFISRQAANDRLKKCYALGLGFLAMSPAIVGIKTIFSKTFQDITSANNIGFSVSHVSSYFKTTAPVFSAALIAYTKIPRSQPLFSIVSAAVGALSMIQPVKADIFCPEQVGSFPFGNLGTTMTAFENYLYIMGDSCCPSPNPNVWIYDVSNVSNPIKVSSFYISLPSHSSAVYGRYAFIHHGSNGVYIYDIKKSCLSSSTESSSLSSITSSLSSTNDSTSSFLISSSTSLDLSSVNSGFSTTTLFSKEQAQTIGDTTKENVSNNLSIGIALCIGIASGLFVGIISGGIGILFILKKQQASSNFRLSEERSFETSTNAVQLTPSVNAIRLNQAEEYQRTPDSVHPKLKEEEYQRTPDFVHPPVE